MHQALPSKRTWSEPLGLTPAAAALGIFVLSFATLAGAWYFQFVLHYQPCHLCLIQRIPYYIVIPLSFAIAIAARYDAPRRFVFGGLAVLAAAALVSAALGGRSEPVYVFLPPGYAENPKERYPALYLLHGTPGRPLNFIQVGDLGVLEDTLVAEHRIHPMVLVMPEGAFGLFGDTEWANSVRPGNDWESWVTEDVVTAVDGRFRVATSADARGIAGLSEGGYGALNIGIHHLDEFHLIESWSGYMGADNIKAIFGGEPSLLRYNSPAITVKAVAPVMRKDGDFIWFYCGSRDGSILGQNYRFASELAMLGVPHEFSVPGGSHSWKLWRSMAGEALQVASTHLTASNPTTGRAARHSHAGKRAAKGARARRLS